MTGQGLLKMTQKFEKTGSSHEQPGRGRKRIDSVVFKEVATAVQEEIGSPMAETPRHGGHRKCLADSFCLH